MIAAERRTALARASALVDLDRTEEAAGVYGGLLRQEPDDVAALCGLSRCLGKLGRADEALDVAQRAAALAPDNDWPHRLRSAHLMQLRRVAEAQQAAHEAVRLDPTGLPSLLTLFETQAGLRDTAGTARTAERVRELHPAQAEAHNCLGRAEMLRGDWTAAEAAFREALRQCPPEAVYQSNLALALERQGRKREALQLFQQAVRTDPGSASARRQLVHAVERRIAVAGGGCVIIAAVAINLVRNVHNAAWQTGVLAAVLAMAAAGLGLRWWRLHRLDESVRRLYRRERRRSQTRTVTAAILLALCAVLGGLFVAVSLGTHSVRLALTAVASVALFFRYPGVPLWRRHVLPRLAPAANLAPR